MFQRGCWKVMSQYSLGSTMQSQSCHTPCNSFKPPDTPLDYIPLNYPIQLHAHKYWQLHGRKMNWHFSMRHAAFQVEPMFQLGG